MRSDPKADEAYAAAIKKWGFAAQLNMVAEECMELALAAVRFFRNRTTPREFAEEIADVEIMCAQARLLLKDGGRGDALVDEIKDGKIRRLCQRLALDPVATVEEREGEDAEV